MNRYTKIKDFHGERDKGIGSSDIPVLAGIYRHRGSTSLRLWEEKTGRRERWNGNERTRVGHDLEAYTLARFVEEKFSEEIADKFYMAKLRDRSHGVFKCNTECRHPERAYVLAHADLLVDPDWPLPYPEPFLVEAKTVGAYAGKRREGQVFSGYDMEDNSAQGIPDAVFLQVQWQMLAYGVGTAWVAALIDNQYSCWGPIQADAKVQANCLALAERFWRLIETDTPPAPETWDDVQALYPHQADTTAMIAGDDETKVREMIARDKALAERANAIDEERNDIKNAIGVLLGANSVLASADGDVLAKSSEQTRESVSLSDLKKKTPEIEAKIREAGLVKSTSFRTVRF